MTSLGVGFLGGGPVTQAIHLPTLARLPELFRVVSVMDVDASIAERVAGRVGAKATTDPDAVLQDREVDVVVICSPNRFHAEQVIAAVDSGKRAVLCEKPLALTRKEAETIARRSEEAGVALVVGAMHVYDPAWVAAAEFWKAGAESIHTVRSTIVLPLNDRFENWATEILDRKPPAAPKGLELEDHFEMLSNGILGLAVHNLPLVRQLVPEFDRVSAATTLPPFGYAVTYSGGGKTVELVGRMEPRWRPDWALDAYGVDASIHAAFPPSYVQAGSARVTVAVGSETKVFGPFDENGYEAEWRHIAELVVGGTAPTASTAIGDLDYALSIDEAAAALFADKIGERH